MARAAVYSHIERVKKKRKGIHSKNASKGQVGYKKAYVGQGK